MDIITLGNPILRKHNKKIIAINDEVIEIAKSLKERMVSAQGLGLAAPQVALNLRMFTIDDEYFRSEFRIQIEEKNSYVINPEIVSKDDSKFDTGEEGCLSIPDVYAAVKRPRNIYVKYLNIKGEQVQFELSGFLARVFQHENDHLNGTLFIDHLEPESRKNIQKELKSIIEKSSK